jgi:hypothetical protein
MISILNKESNLCSQNKALTFLDKLVTYRSVAPLIHSSVQKLAVEYLPYSLLVAEKTGAKGECNYARC